MENRAGVARFTSIMRIIGGGDRVTIDIPVNASPMWALQPVNLMFISDQYGDSAAGMSFDTQLFSQHEFLVSGVTTVPVSLIVESFDDLPRIINTGAGKSPPALLAWNDRKYSVPPLSPNQDWRPSSAPEPWGANRPEQLFRQRAMFETTALLFEYPSGNQQPSDAAHIYLMVRP